MSQLWWYHKSNSFSFFFLGLNEKQKQNKSTMQCHHGMNDCRHVSFRCPGLNVTVITIIFSLLILNFCLSSQSQPHRFVNRNIKRLWEHFSKLNNCEECSIISTLSFILKVKMDYSLQSCSTIIWWEIYYLMLSFHTAQNLAVTPPSKNAAFIVMTFSLTVPF